MGQFFSGGVDQPTAKSYGEVHKEAIEALIKSMGQMYTADSAFSKLFNALSHQDQSDALKEYNKDYNQAQLDAMEYNKRYSIAALNYQKAYGNQYLQQQIAGLRQADPEYWASYDAQGAEILADLNRGNQLTDTQARNVQQATRAQQAARGNTYGNASAAKEVYDQFMAGEAAQAQRQSAAQNFLQNSPFRNFNIGAITAYTPQVSTSGYSTLAPYAYSNAMSAAQGNAQYEANNYRLRNGWSMIEYNQPAPFFSMISGGLNGAASGAMTGAMMGGPFGAIAGGVIGGVSGGVMGAFGR